MSSKITESSKRSDWETPQWLFDELNAIFNFSWDLASSEENCKVRIPSRGNIAAGYTETEDALTKDWKSLKGWLWCNPPYKRGKGSHIDFCKKAAGYKSLNAVFLIPGRLDRWFLDHVLPNGCCYIFPKRLQFELDGKPYTEEWARCRFNTIYDKIVKRHKKNITDVIKQEDGSTIIHYRMPIEPATFPSALWLPGYHVVPHQFQELVAKYDLRRLFA